MGKIKQGVLGGFSGTVGPVVGGSWKGIQTIRSKATSVAYAGSNSQVAQTSKMSGVVGFSKQLLSQIIKPLWDGSAVRMSGYNAFVRENIKAFVGNEISIPEKVYIAKGKMEPIPFTIEEGVVPNTVTFDWSASTVNDALALSTDVAFCVVFDPNYNFIGFGATAIRSAGTAVINLKPGVYGNGNYPCFLAFKSANGKRIATSYSAIYVIADAG